VARVAHCLCPSVRDLPTGKAEMIDWILGFVLVSFVVGICWLIREFVNAPLCDEQGQCFK
jgi:hypothetical protein